MEIKHKGYRIVPLDTFPMVRIMAPTSGDVPQILKGLFTNVEFAKKQIDVSLAVKTRRRGKAHAEEVSTPTG